MKLRQLTDAQNRFLHLFLFMLVGVTLAKPTWACSITQLSGSAQAMNAIISHLETQEGSDSEIITVDRIDFKNYKVKLKKQSKIITKSYKIAWKDATDGSQCSQVVATPK